MKSIVFVVNYENEINEELKNFVKDKMYFYIFNENKGYNFSLKLLKLLTKLDFKPELVIHYGLAGTDNKQHLGKIYQIKRSFLYNEQNLILDSVKHRFVDSIYLFDIYNIVTKFKIGQHSKIILDFSDIFDLETFWVGNITNFFSFPIISLKGISDLNQASLYSFTEYEEINILLNPNLKRNKKQIILSKIKGQIDFLSFNLLKKIETLV